MPRASRHVQKRSIQLKQARGLSTRNIESKPLQSVQSDEATATISASIQSSSSGLSSSINASSAPTTSVITSALSSVARTEPDVRQSPDRTGDGGADITAARGAAGDTGADSDARLLEVQQLVSFAKGKDEVTKTEALRKAIQMLYPYELRPGQVYALRKSYLSKRTSF